MPIKDPTETTTPAAPPRVEAFLSYQSSDETFVKALASCLRANGVEVFLDKWDITPGDSIPSGIEEALARCQLFLYVLSPASVESKWVQAEYHAFLYRKMNEHELRIIPVLWRDCTAPPFVAPLRRVDFRNFDPGNPTHLDAGNPGPLQELLGAIYRTPQKPPLGAPHPSLASYEFYFQTTKAPPADGEGLYYEIGFKNLTDSPLHNFTFALRFSEPIEEITYKAGRSSANMTGGQGLSADRMRFHWRGNQLMEDGGWAVFIIRTRTALVIKRVSTKLLGRQAETLHLILPDPVGLVDD